MPVLYTVYFCVSVFLSQDLKPQDIDYFKVFNLCKSGKLFFIVCVYLQVYNVINYILQH